MYVSPLGQAAASSIFMEFGVRGQVTDGISQSYSWESSTSPGIVQTTVEGHAVNLYRKSVEGRLAIGYGGQFHFSGIDPQSDFPVLIFTDVSGHC